MARHRIRLRAQAVTAAYAFSQTEMTAMHRNVIPFLRADERLRRVLRTDPYPPGIF